jgi:hypothetical protein
MKKKKKKKKNNSSELICIITRLVWVVWLVDQIKKEVGHLH